MHTTIETGSELVELGRFFTIAGRRLAAGDTFPEMFSGAVDAVWHTLADDHAAHATFTTAHAGQPLTHVKGVGSGCIGWIASYEEAYGPLPKIWFTSADGSVDTEALARYRETGTVVAEWNCSPAPGDGDVVPMKSNR
ncbi:hypothetical protein ACIGZJ_26890 [Kitasatospora sp. NPDC052868]|uniref:hypothetical protein n=1 Tax=Kitasatospora sp. NPDC052868 TaxID=3364060 RepID=UPI0037C61606